jgi:hypothetical protein
MSDHQRAIAELTPKQMELLRLRLSRLQQKDGHDSHGRHAPITPRGGTSDTFPLSFAQQRLWVVDQLAPGNPAYNIALGVRLKGRLDVAALERSLREIVRRHESLRTTFTSRGGTPVQVISPQADVGLALQDLSAFAEPEREAEGERLAAAEARRPFDLERGPLLRVALLKFADDDHVLLRTVHHIVSDKISEDIFVRELATLYEAFSAGRPSPLPPLPIQYADYAQWQREWLGGDVLRGQIDYWETALAGAPPALDLPTDMPRPPVQTFRGARLTREFSPELTAEVEALAEREGCLLFMAILSAFKVVLLHLSGQDDLVVGTTISGRHRQEVAGLIGFFINTLVLRTGLSGDPTLRELMGRVRETVLAAEEHQYLPFEKLVEEMHVERDPSRHPLFQVIFNIQQHSADAETELPGLSLSRFGAADTASVKFDITVFNLKTPDRLIYAFVYNTDLFRERTVARMMDDYDAVLRRALAHPDVRLSELLGMLSEGRQRRLADERAGMKEANLQRLKSVRRRVEGAAAGGRE